LFYNLRINIFVFYILTTTTFLAILYYFLEVAKVENIFLLFVFLFCFMVLVGVFISKLAIDPLLEYVKTLQNLSKETLHELNLPITTIKTNTQMLRKNVQNEKNIKRLTRIESGCNMLLQRYNELDYLIKTQTKMQIKESIKLDELVKQRVEFLKSVYPNVEFNLKLDRLNIINDKIGLSKVIDNIIDNGVKYSPNSNKIDIEIVKNTLYIKDYGNGMDEVELLQIFDTYYQSNPTAKGFGIGLSMVKRFCDNNRIYLSFNSKPKIGTTVILKFKEK